LIAKLKSAVPDIALSTDIIVGYPGETDREFEDTLKLMESASFSSSFMFSYSPRPGTPAADFLDSVPESEKQHRLQQTIEHQNRLTEKEGQKYLGKDVQVLIEGRTSKNGKGFKGRSPHYWRVNFPETGQGMKPGDLVNIEVKEVHGHTLKGIAKNQ
jgi:tRNA-2-methylthio-N6-dimethylallyladenosine synthase